MQEIYDIYYYDIGTTQPHTPQYTTAITLATDLSVINAPEVAILNPGAL